MLETSSWKRLSLRVIEDLHLDPMNVRLETANAQVEADIIEDLFDNENVLDLVDAISKIGYLTHEIPIAVKRRGKHVVVEGNRRLAALKSIQNPKIVPTFEARVAQRAKAMGATRDKLKSIEILVAPNQAQADQLIAALHTSNPRKPWSPARQAAFFQAQIDSGRTYRQLLGRYPTIDVPDFVLRARLVNRFKDAVASDANLSDFIGSKPWKDGFSAMTRIFESKEFRALTGIALDEDGRLTISIDDQDFDRIAGLIVQGMYERNIDTRTLNKVSSPRFLKLMSEIRDILAESRRPDVDGPDEPDDGDGGGGGGGDTPPPGGGTGRGRGGSTRKKTAPTKRSRRPKTTILPIGDVVLPEAYGEPFKAHFEELSLINIQRTPIAAFLMLRAILEKSIKAYADAKGIDIAGTGNSTNGRVQLHHCLNWLIDYFRKNGKKDLVDPVNRVQGGRLSEFTSTKDALNALNHNYRFSVDPDEVERAWQSIDPLMRELLNP